MSKWIDVNESLPPEGERVLVCCQTKKGLQSINLAYQSDGFWHGTGSMSGVIAWMPLPQLPGEAERVSPCDVCRYYPPSSFDGKPCTVCPAAARIVD